MDEIVLCCDKCKREWLTTDKDEECPFCKEKTLSIMSDFFACSGAPYSDYSTMLQDIKIEVEELDHHGPYCRYVQFPIEGFPVSS